MRLCIQTAYTVKTTHRAGIAHLSTCRHCIEASRYRCVLSASFAQRIHALKEGLSMGTPLTRRKQRMRDDDVNHATRAHMALDLRIKERLSYDEIAERCGYADQNVVKSIIKRELERTIVHDIEQLRDQEGLTYDILQAECMKIFMDTDSKIRLFALDRILIIMQQRAKLYGLEAKEEQMQMQTVLVRQIPAGYFGAIDAMTPPQITETKQPNPIMEEEQESR